MKGAAAFKAHLKHNLLIRGLSEGSANAVLPAETPSAPPRVVVRVCGTQPGSVQAGDLRHYLHISTRKEGTNPCLSHLPGFELLCCFAVWKYLRGGVAVGRQIDARARTAVPHRRDQGFEELRGGFGSYKARAPAFFLEFCCQDRGERCGNSAKAAVIWELIWKEAILGNVACKRSHVKSPRLTL